MQKLKTCKNQKNAKKKQKMQKNQKNQKLQKKSKKCKKKLNYTKQSKILQRWYFDRLEQIKMDIQQQNNLSEFRKNTEIEEQSPIPKNDLFQDLFIHENQQLIAMDSFVQPYQTRSKKKNLKIKDFRKILNSSSSNQRLIPSEIKYQSSRENSQRDRQVLQMQNSFDSESFRKSFKKRVDQSFSVQNTIRDSSSSFSERSERSYASFLPSVYKQENDGMKSERKFGCNCKRSKCLKLYCECFQKKIFCNQNCHCYDCGNHKQNAAEHKQAIIEALARNAHGFDEEGQEEKKQNPEQKTLTFSLGFELQEVKKGCKCRKTHCIKKYCECYQNGDSCGVFCKCEDCHNTTINRQNNHFMSLHNNKQIFEIKKFY